MIQTFASMNFANVAIIRDYYVVSIDRKEYMRMDPHIMSIVAMIAWEAIKDGVKLTYEQISKKLKEGNLQNIQNEDCKEIADILNNIPNAYKANAKLVEGYLEANEHLLTILSGMRKENYGNINQYSFGSGDNVGRDKIVKG